MKAVTIVLIVGKYRGITYYIVHFLSFALDINMQDVMQIKERKRDSERENYSRFEIISEILYYVFRVNITCINYNSQYNFSAIIARSS